MPKQSHLAAVQTMTETDDDPGALREIDLPAVPSQPVLDELASDRNAHQAALDDANAKLASVANEIVSQSAYFDREQARLDERRNATMGALEQRERALKTIIAGREAALAATQPQEG